MITHKTTKHNGKAKQAPKTQAPKTWTHIENPILDHPRLSLYARVVYIYLRRYAQRTGPWAGTTHISLSTLAERARISRRSVATAITDLHDAGIIIPAPTYSRGGARRASRYWLVPALPDLQPSMADLISLARSTIGSIPDDLPRVVQVAGSYETARRLRLAADHAHPAATWADWTDSLELQEVQT